MAAARARAARGSIGLQVTWTCPVGHIPPFVGTIDETRLLEGATRAAVSERLPSVERVASRIPDEIPADLRRDLARWLLVLSSLMEMDPARDDARTMWLWGMPAATWEPAAAMVERALRLEAEQIEVLSLSLPAWFPQVLQRRVARLLLPHLASGELDQQRAIQRLATDSRMHWVWDQFRSARRRRLGDREHLVRLRAPPTADEGVNREHAMSLLLELAHSSFSMSAPAMTPKELDEARETAARARQFEAELSAIRHGHWQPPPSRLQRAQTDSLLARFAEIAEETERRLDLAEKLPITVLRHRIKDARLDGFLVRLLSLTSSAFGTPLYEIVRVVASVLFQQNVKKSVVVSVGRRLRRAGPSCT